MTVRAFATTIGRFVLAAGLAAGVAVADSTPVAGQAQELTPLAQCLSDNQSLSVLFLVDTSQSLTQTDPGAQRVQGLQSAVQTLVSIATQPTAEGGEVPEVFIEFADFGTTTRRSFPGREPWAAAGDPADIGRIAEFAGRNRSQDTDYVGALEPWVNLSAPDRPADEIGALELLEQAPEGSCRSLIWFTDGQFDIDYQGEAKQIHWTEPPFDVSSDRVEVEAELRGMDRLCRPGDLADRLRSGPITEGSGAYLTVVALGDPVDFDLIRSITDGTGSIPCGEQPPRGEVLDADSLGELIYTLTEGANPASSVLPDGPVPTCQASAVDDEVSMCDLSFRLAPTIRAFNLLTLAGNPAVSTSLITPNGVVVPFAGGGVDLESGARLEIEQLGSSGDVFRVEGSLEEGGSWAGLWRLRFESGDEALVREAVNKASMYLFFRTLEAELRDAGAPLRVGRSRMLTVQLTNPSDEPASDEAFVDGSEIDVYVNGDEVSLSPIAPDGSFTFEIALPEDAPIDDLVVTADVRPVVRVTEDTPVIELQPWSGELARLTVEPLPKRPIIDSFEPIDDSMDQENRTVRSRAFVDAIAPDSGGCVRLVEADAPFVDGLGTEGSAAFTFNGEPVDIGDDCPIRLADGESGYIELELSIDGVELDKAEHFINGTVVFETEGLIEPVQVGEEPLTYQAVIKPKVLNETDWGKVLLFSALALLVPLLLLIVANWIAAKLRFDRSAHVALDVALVDGRLVRTGRGADEGVSFEASDLNSIGNPPEGAEREATIAGFDFEARTPLNPFGDVSATVTRPGCPVVVGDLGTSKKANRGRTPVVMSRAWAFAATSDPVRTVAGEDELDRVNGRLLIVCPPLHTTAIPYLNSRTSEIAEIVQRNLVRHAIDPSPEPVTPEPGPADKDFSGGTSRLFSPADEVVDPTPVRLDPFGNPVVAPAPAHTPGSTEKRKRRRSKKRSSDDPPPPPMNDGPPLPF